MFICFKKNYDNPVITPLLSISIRSAFGTAGKPGIRITSPKSGTTNPAPEEISNSRTVISKLVSCR
jgi:hypothetical protein